MHAGKWKAVVTEVLRFHKQGRPILVGTTSVESSEALAQRLRDQGTPRPRQTPLQAAECPAADHEVQERDRPYQQARQLRPHHCAIEHAELTCAAQRNGGMSAGIPFRLLNAKPENVERESEIVSASGRRGAVTIATNMAGRGTDIILGGNAEFMARHATLDAGSNHGCWGALQPSC